MDKLGPVTYEVLLEDNRYDKRHTTVTSCSPDHQSVRVIGKRKVSVTCTQLTWH